MSIPIPASETWTICPLKVVLEYQTLPPDLQNIQIPEGFNIVNCKMGELYVQTLRPVVLNMRLQTHSIQSLI